MIYADICDCARYYGIAPHLDTALRFLEHADLNTLVPGRNDVDEENVYINRFDYETLPPEKTFFEAHERYADVHLLLSGEENIGVSSPEMLQETDRNVETDFIGYQGPAETICHMTSKKLLILFPGEPHQVAMEASGTSKIEKAVIKVRI